MKFRKKPVVIEAVQWDGGNIAEVEKFIGLDKWKDILMQPVFGLPLVIHTLEGDHKANVGDWIIKGVKGEFYPCKPDIFELTYESVEE